MPAADRQYIASAALSAGAAALFLALLFLFLAWSGWKGLFVVLAPFAAFFAWFYLGPRPDLARGAPRGEPPGSRR